MAEKSKKKWIRPHVLFHVQYIGTIMPQNYDWPVGDIIYGQTT